MPLLFAKKQKMIGQVHSCTELCESADEREYTEILKQAEARGEEKVAFCMMGDGYEGVFGKERLETARRAVSGYLEENDSEIEVFLLMKDDEPEIRKNHSFYELPIPAFRTVKRSKAAAAVHEACVFEAPILGSSVYDEADCMTELEKLIAVEHETFHGMLMRLIGESGMSNSQVYTRANMTKQTFSKIRNNPEMIPKKKTVIGLAVALKLDMETTEKLLQKAGYALSDSSGFDIVIRFFMEREIFDYFEINSALFELGMEEDLIGYN